MPALRVKISPLSDFFKLSILHILNDGFLASLLLLLPFIAKTEGLDLIKVGFLGTVLNVFSIVLALPAAAIARKLGGLKALVIALCVYGIGYIGASLIGGYGWLLVMFALAGCGFGIFHPVAFSLIAEQTSKATRGKTLGDFTAIGDLGRIGIAAVLAFLAASIGWSHTALLYGLVALVPGAFLLFWTHAKNRPAIETGPTPKQQPPIIRLFGNFKFVCALIADSLDTFASDSLYVFLPFLLVARDVQPGLLGLFTATFFIGNLLGKTGMGRIADKLGSARVFIASELLMAAFILLLGHTRSLLFIVVASIALGIFTKGTVPILKAMLAESVEGHGNFNQAFSLAEFSASTAKTVAPALIGAIAARLGIVPAFDFMAVAVLVAAVPAAAFFIRKPARQAQSRLS